MSRSGPLGRPQRGNTRVRKYLRRGLTLAEARNQARKETMRAYAARRRRDPEFRVKETRAAHLSKKLRDPHFVPNLREIHADCEFCGVRRATTTVDRLVVYRHSGEFVGKTLRYCGKC